MLRLALSLDPSNEAVLRVLSDADKATSARAHSLSLFHV